MRSPTLGHRPARSIAVVLSLSILGAILAACGSSASAPYRGAAPGEAAPLPAASAAPVGNPVNGNNSSGSGSGSGSVAGNDGDQAAIFDETKIVRTGSLQLTVADVATALSRGRTAIASLGGYIGSSQQEKNGDQIVASVTYRIPVSRWEDALSGLRALGTEVGEKTDSTEVTGQLVDLDARIRNLKATEMALVGYAEKAPKVTDLLEIESRLSDTRGQIEQLSAQQARLQDQAAMSTLTVTYGTEVEAVVETAQRWDPAAEVDRASATLIGMGQAVVSFGIVFLIVWVPLIVAVVFVGGITLLVARRLGFGRPDRLPPLAPPPSSAEV